MVPAQTNPMTPIKIRRRRCRASRPGQACCGLGRGAVGATLLWAAAMRGQEETPSAGEETIHLDRLTVHGEAVPGGIGPAADRFEWAVPSSLADDAETIPGLALHRMGAAAAEPLLRGLGSDRVVTTLDGLPMPNASPTRTDSALALISAGLPAGFEIIRSLPSVTLGPPANAGYIDLSLSPARGDRKPHPTYFGAAWNAGRDGGDLLVSQDVAQGGWGGRATLAAHHLGDYTAGDGTTVPAADRSVGAAFSLDWQPDPQHQLRLGALWSRQELAVNSALPLDTRHTEATAFTTRYGWALSDTTRIDTRLAIGITRPHLDNAGRPAPALIFADGRTRSFAAGVLVHRQTAGLGELAFGVDATREERRLERKRPGAVDLLWPDLQQDDAGVFAEIARALVAGWKLRLGARVDAARSEARAADGVAFNRTIRDLYAAYNGAGAAQTKRRETAGAANALVTGRLSPEIATSIGAGFSRQPPGASERYRAFSDALGGGYEIGNPAAETEDKYELDAGLRWQRSTLTVSLDLFAEELPDYLHRTRVGVTAGPPPPPPGAIVYGYRATDAFLRGGELEMRWQPVAGAWGRLAVAGVEATDRHAHRALPEIPPATVTLAAGYAWSQRPVRPWFELAIHAATAQRNPAPDEMPVFADTSAFALGSVRAGVIWRGWRVGLAVENLFDRLYYDYLSPSAGATPSSGTLRPGARIPGPGRTILITISRGGR
jgi:outer membrane receptor protein involved in Fe transport